MHKYDYVANKKSKVRKVYEAIGKHSKKLSSTGIRFIVNDALKIQGLRNRKKKKVTEFKRCTNLGVSWFIKIF